MQQHKIYNAQNHAIRNTPYRSTNTMKEFRSRANAYNNIKTTHQQETAGKAT